MKGYKMSENESKNFYADMPVAEAMAIHPRVAEVFAAFHLGGCAHCGISRFETIEQVCMAYGIETEVLLQVLEDLVAKAKAEEQAQA